MSRRLIALAAAFALVALLAAPVQSASPKGDRAAPESVGERTAIKERSGRVGPAVNPVPAGTVGVRSSIAYLEGSNVAIVAEVLNNTTVRREFVEVEAVLYDESDTVLGSISDVVFLERLGYGAVGPAVLVGPAPDGLHAYTISVSDQGAAIATPPAGVPPGLTSNPVIIDGGAQLRRYGGVISNTNTFGANFYVYVTTYDADGDVLDATWDGPLALGPSTSTGYQLDLFYDPALPVARAVINSDGRAFEDANMYVTTFDNYFDDVGTSSFRKDIVWLAEQGITKGCGAGRYCPIANVRRDEMASFLARALELTASAPDAFVDDAGNAHQANINRIAAAGITAGCNPAAHLYCPAANVRRDEMASFLSRALGLTGNPPNAFTDDDGNTHELNINRVAFAGVTTGCGGTNYCPALFVTRAQMAAFLHRAFE